VLLVLPAYSHQAKDPPVLMVPQVDPPVLMVLPANSHREDSHLDQEDPEASQADREDPEGSHQAREDPEGSQADQEDSHQAPVDPMEDLLEASLANPASHSKDTDREATHHKGSDREDSPLVELPALVDSGVTPGLLLELAELPAVTLAPLAPLAAIPALLAAILVPLVLTAPLVLSAGILLMIRSSRSSLMSASRPASSMSVVLRRS